MRNEIAQSSFGLALCKTNIGDSLKGVMPTKIAEFLSVGRPVVVSEGIGDLEDNVLAIGTFTTPSKSVPSPEILELNIEENRVNFDVDIDDPLMLILEGSLNAHIYVNGELIDSSPVINNHVDFQIFNLFANELFEIRITASYDLNDGSPLHVDEIIFTEEYTDIIPKPNTCFDLCRKCENGIKPKKK